MALGSTIKLFICLNETSRKTESAKNEYIFKKKIIGLLNIKTYDHNNNCFGFFFIQWFALS